MPIPAPAGGGLDPRVGGISPLLLLVGFVVQSRDFRQHVYMSALPIRDVPVRRKRKRKQQMQTNADMHQKLEPDRRTVWRCKTISSSVYYDFRRPFRRSDDASGAMERQKTRQQLLCMMHAAAFVALGTCRDAPRNHPTCLCPQDLPTLGSLNSMSVTLYTFTP